MRPSRRSKLAARAAIVLVASLLAVGVFRFGAGHSLAASDPVRAAQWAPGDARAAVAAARARLDAGEDARSQPVQQLVHAALARDLTVPAAIEIRAVQLESAGDARRAARLYELSSAISRRSLPTRLWLIQRSVDRGDVQGALANFDLALRTSSAAPDILFPVLAGAASDPGLVEPIARVLDRPSDWRAMFLSYAVSDAGAAVPIAEIVLRMRDREAILDNQIDQMLIGQLIEEHAFAQARRVHDSLGTGKARSSMVRDSDFSDLGSRYPFGWGLIESAETGAARELVAGRSALAYRGVPGADGQVATQLLMLAPGAYRLVSTNAAAPADPLSPPFWTVTCAGDGGTQIGLLHQSVTEGGTAAADFSVTGGCTAQWLALNLRGSDLPGGQSGAIGSVNVLRR